jgi:hypothetical protein
MSNGQERGNWVPRSSWYDSVFMGEISFPSTIKRKPIGVWDYSVTTVQHVTTWRISKTVRHPLWLWWRWRWWWWQPSARHIKGVWERYTSGEDYFGKLVWFIWEVANSVRDWLWTQVPEFWRDANLYTRQQDGKTHQYALGLKKLFSATNKLHVMLWWLLT